MGPSGGRHVSDNIDAGIGGAGLFAGHCRMYNVQLYSEPWGHVDHSDANCACLSSDRTAAYVHDLALMPRECLPVSEVEDASVHTEESGARMSHAYCMGMGQPAPGCVCAVEDGLVSVL